MTGAMVISITMICIALGGLILSFIKDKKDKESKSAKA